MNESPLRFLDYDVSLLLNEYVEKEIKKQKNLIFQVNVLHVDQKQ